METLIMDFPEEKIALVKMLFKELGVIILNDSSVDISNEEITQGVDAKDKFID